MFSTCAWTTTFLAFSSPCLFLPSFLFLIAHSAIKVGQIVETAVREG